jgi:hypothetical protein
MTIVPIAKYNFVSIMEAHRSCVMADCTEKVFTLLRRNSEGRIYRRYRMTYLSSRLFHSLNSPCELIKRLMSIPLHIKCIRRMINIHMNDFGSDCVPGEGFQCMEHEGLAEFGR